MLRSTTKRIIHIIKFFARCVGSFTKACTILPVIYLWTALYQLKMECKIESKIYMQIPLVFALNSVPIFII